MTDPTPDLTPEEAEHLEKLLARVKAGLMTMEEAALIMRVVHPDLAARVRAITGEDDAP